MDKVTRRKSWQTWSTYLLISFGIVAVSGFSVLPVQATSTHDDLVSTRRLWVEGAHQIEVPSQVIEGLDRQDAWSLGYGYWSLGYGSWSSGYGYWSRTSPKMDDQTQAIWPKTILIVTGLTVVLFLSWFCHRYLWGRRDAIELFLIAQIAFYLPEECVAELGVLRRRLQKANVSPWQRSLRLFQELVSLLWVFYIQIKLANLWLPRDRKIDD